jgi:hypothetical protein
MHKGIKAAAALAACLLSSTAALAQGAPNPPGNLEKLSNFQGTGASMDIPTIAQEGRKADAIARTLKQIKLPEGFKISLYAIVPDARHMAVGPQGVVTFVGTRKNKVYAVTDRDKDRVADEVKVFAPSIDFTIPNGVCFSRDGFLFIAEQNRVLMFPAAEFFYEGPGRGGLPAREGRRADPEGRGELQPHRPHLPGGARRQGLRVARPALQRLRPEKMDKYAKTGIGGIIRMDREGKNREVFATGIRNSWAWTSTRRTRPSGSPTTRWTGWATTSRRARSTGPTRPGCISGSRTTAAARCAPPSTRTSRSRQRRSPPRSRRSPTPPTSA